MILSSRNSAHRNGTTTVELAFVLPVTLMFILMILIGGAGVFRYQQLATLSREAARYAAVHGKQYEKETGNPAATPEEIYTNVILKKAAILKPAHLSYSVTWDKDKWPQSIDGNSSTPTQNTVTVTVTYVWHPEIPFLDPVTMTSTTTMPMAY